MNEYSESWRHLKALLAGYATRNSEAKAPSYEDQRHAKALSIFLTSADLATPRLNRETVDAVLAGKIQWPRTETEGNPYIGTDIPLSRFEELGLVSFYAGWCATHTNSVRDAGNIDPTLIPVVKAMEHLKDIRWGRNGYIQPHYACNKSDLKNHLQTEFGERISVEQLLPELEVDGDMFKLQPGNQNFSAEISTQLWTDLRREHPPEEAFNHWILYFCVNCEFVMPVIFDRYQYRERKEFHDLLLKFLTEDSALNTCIDSYIRQSINEYDFSGRIQPMQIQHEIAIDQNNDQMESNTSKKILARPNLSSLEEIYPLPLGEAASAIEFVTCLHDRWIRGPEFFYSWLLSTVVEDSIHIEIAHLSSSGLVEKLVDLANAHRPVLKYLLYIILPSYALPNYMSLLLALNKTSDVAFFHLAKRSFDRSRTADTAYVQCLEDGYQKLLCREYVQAIKNGPDFSPRFVAVLKIIGEQCGLHSPDFFKRTEFRLLLTLLDSLTDKQVFELAQRFTEFSVEIEISPYGQARQHFRYLLGFWVIDRIERTGTDPTEAICEAVREALRTQYEAEFLANLAGLRSLEPNSFFETLSWKQLFVGVGQDFMLGISNQCNEWGEILAYENKGSYGAALAICHYLQVLISAGLTSNEAEKNQEIAARVQEIIRLCGFKNPQKYAQLFGGLAADKFDLWQQVCIYSNLFTDELYRDFIIRCVPLVPLNLLLELLKRTSVIAREQLLHEAIDKHLVDSNNALSLYEIESAFNFVFNFGRIEVASRMLSSAKKILADEQYSNTKNRNFIRVRKVWQSYEYKFQIINLYESYRQDPATFKTLVDELPIPHDSPPSQLQPDDRANYDECEYFRRQLVATAYCDVDPAKTVIFMKQLYKETQRKHHGFVLLYGHVKLFAINQNKLELKSALTTFLAITESERPNSMDEHWVAIILEAYLLSGAEGVDHFWAQLSPQQQGRRLIFTPYCRALLARRDSFTVKKILARYKEINHATLDELDIDDLISELAKIEKDAPSMKDFLLIMAESSQRTVEQLQKHYNQIIAKDFEAYVEVVKPNLEPHEYLKEAILAVAGELVLRKRNLQVLHKDEKGNISFNGITLEDWINDWFVSLFDQRMSHARLSLRDQKRGGHSASGKGPGEIDGFITSSSNERIGIFEAFRLFSVDTNTIGEHLNKIAGYDGESLSPVVIVGYCDVKKFANLVEGYQAYVSAHPYKGYMSVESSSGMLKTLHNVDHIWLGNEIRRRGHKDIVFYHLLINLHFSPPTVTTA
ncbi:hypothetical protein [Aeromonas allosaccharophila]|uniref:hypothetical protein n=1 Tax=Aeromonas allosaccharophila TaxID=656 RepID=UPI000AE00B83|nr:hypothetical protein [Aeromonas allosaccharophila]